MAERYIPEHRRTQFKARNQFRPDELRRRREEQQVEIRKQKREENMAKRRGVQTRDGGVGVGGMAAATESDDEASAIESEVSFPFFSVPLLVLQGIYWKYAMDDAIPSCLCSNALGPLFLLCDHQHGFFFHRPVAMGPTPPPRTITMHNPTIKISNHNGKQKTKLT